MHSFLKAYINGVLTAIKSSLMVMLMLCVLCGPGLVLGNSIVWLLTYCGIVLAEHVSLFIYGMSVAFSMSVIMEYEELDVDVLPFANYYKVYTAIWYNNDLYGKDSIKSTQVFSSLDKAPSDIYDERGACTFSTVSEEDAVNKLKQFVKEKFNKDID